MGSWTKEQLNAIETRNSDILVAAAAGSGKTAVLVERIIALITEGENPIDIDRLLVVTFTKAAASEMSQRIGDALAKKIEQNPENEHIQNQLTYLNRADIKTIDAFCLKIVKENYNLLDIDPTIRTADETETLLLKSEVMEELFEELYTEVEEDFFALVEAFGEDTRDLRLKGLILELYDFVQSNPFPEQWLKEHTEVFYLNENDSLDDTIWIKIVKETIQTELLGAIDTLHTAQQLIAAIDGFEGYSDCIENDLEMISELLDSLEFPYERLCQIFLSAKLKTLRPYRGEDITLADRIKGKREEVKNTIKSLKEKFFSFDAKEMKKHIQNLYPIVKELSRVVILFSEKYQLAKKEKQLVDFNDYGHFCIQVLLEEGSTLDNPIPSPVAMALQQRYDEILIDEYQDSNLIQEIILSVISKKSRNENNRFMVGDVKQSIYRFRLAKPELFMQKYNQYQWEGLNKEKRIDLSKNFRSRKTILDGVNFLFKQLMTQRLGEIQYDEKAALYPGFQFPTLTQEGSCGGPIEVMLIDTHDEKEEETQLDIELLDISKREVEAEAIAQRIHKLIEEEAYYILDKKTGEYRKAQYRDIVILLRGTKAWSGVFETVFSRYNIPFYEEISTGYFDTEEILIMLHILKVIDNPRQDIPLISVLHSPIYRLTSDMLMNIKLDGGQEDFYNCIYHYMEQRQQDCQFGDLEIVQKLEQFLSDLKKWREKSVHTSISELLWYLYHDTGYFDYVGITTGGKIKQANLRFLVEKAIQYEKSSHKSLFYFIRYISEIKDNIIDVGSAKIVSENENLVKIMTIHKSKGLEFPIVFVSDLGRQFNKMDKKAAVILHQDLGFGLNDIDYENRVIYTLLPKTALSVKVDNENLSEELRILYVAFTRAKEKLILTGTVNGLEKNIQKWLMDSNTDKTELPYYRLLKARTYLDWLLPAVARHTDFHMLWDTYNFHKNYKNSELEFDSSLWKFELLKKSDLIAQTQVQITRSGKIHTDFKSWDSNIDYSGKRKEIFDCLSWQYPYQIETALPAKVSISELKRRALFVQEENQILYEEKELLFEQPEFLIQKGTMSGAKRGTVLHTFLEHADFSICYDKQKINDEIEREISVGILTEEEAKTIYKNSVELFFQSDIMKRIRKSEQVEKEKAFAIVFQPDELFTKEKIKSQEDILVNGIIDCYFYEGEEIVLLDYKTDYVGENGAEELKQKYYEQLTFYQKALERISGKKVKERYIYSFALNKEILI